MNLNPIKNLSVKIGLAIGAAMAFISTAGGAIDITKNVVVWLQQKLHFPANNTVTTILMIGLLIIVVTAIMELGKRIFVSVKKARIANNAKNAREAYLKWVTKDVEERMRSSIHHARYIDLQLNESNKFVDSWTFIYHSTSEDNEKQVASFNELIQAKPFSVLLLGAPGAGKTTTLLNAIQYCIDEAVRDEANPIPVMMNLSKWRKKENVTGLLKWHRGKEKSVRKEEEEIIAEDFADWIIKAASGLKGSGLTPEVVEGWLKDQKIALFLDGLDEAQESFRGTIVEKINSFLADNSISIIICSRSADYEALVKTSDIRLKLDGAVTIQPLNPEQINEYLIAANATNLQDFLDNDEPLKEMAKSPLDLSIMVIASANTDFGKLISTQTKSITAKRSALFDAYVIARVQRQQRRSMSSRLVPESEVLKKGVEVPQKKLSRLNKYLGWIARLLSERSRTVFSPGKLYEYLFEQNDDRPFCHVNIVNGLVLLAGLVIVSILFSAVYNPWALGGAAACLMVSYYLTLYGVRGEETAKKIAAILFAIWPAIMIAIPLLYMPVKYLFSIWDYSIWILIFLFAIAYILFSYRILTLDGPERSLSEALSAPIWQHLLNIVVLAAPVLFMIFFKGSSYPQWVFLYIIVATIDAIVIGQLLEDNDKITRTIFNAIVGLNVYGIAAAVTGMLIFQDRPDLTIFFALEIMMAIGFISFFSEYDFALLGMFIGSLLGILSGLVLAPVYTLIVAVPLMIILTLYGGRIYGKIMSAIGNAVVLFFIKLRMELPFRFNKFLKYSIDVLLLKRSTAEYEFIHRRVRDHFAIRQFVPLLEGSSPTDRIELVNNICALKDASCDVLLEMVDDHDKEIRTTCIKGLGQIGSAIAATTLLNAIKQTSGDLRTLAIDQMSSIRDIAAAPALIEILNTEPIKSPLFQNAFYSLWSGLGQLHAWQNTAKLEACLFEESLYTGHRMYELKPEIRLILLERGKKEAFQSKVHQANTLIELGLNKEWREVMASMEIDELKQLLAHNNDYEVVRTVSFQLCEKDFRLATYALMDELKKNATKLPYMFAPKTNFYPFVKEIIQKKDPEYLHPALQLLKFDLGFRRSKYSFFQPFYTVYQRLHHKRVERALLEVADSLGPNEKAVVIEHVAKISAGKCVPFLVNCLNCQDSSVSFGAAYNLQHLKFRSKALSSACISFVRDNPDAWYNQYVIPELAKNGSPEVVPVLLKTLESANKDVVNATINALGVLKAAQARPALLKLFHEQDPQLLGALVIALQKLNEVSIIPSLAKLFSDKVLMRKEVLTALIGFGADKEIMEAFQLVQREKDPLNSELLLPLAVYFITKGRSAEVAELIYPLAPFIKADINEYYAVSSPFIDQANYKLQKIRRDTLFSEVISSARASDYSVGQRMQHAAITLKKLQPSNDVADGKWDWDMVFVKFGLSTLGRRILEIMYAYDRALSKELAIALFENRHHALSKLLVNKLQSDIPKDQKLLIIAVMGSYDLSDTIPVLQKYLIDHDPDVADMAMQALGAMKDRSSTGKFIGYLSSPNATLVNSALNAIDTLSYSALVKIDNLPQLLYDNPQLQETMAVNKYSRVLENLKEDDLLKFMDSNQPLLRYLGAVFSGIAGYGGTIEKLNTLLHDDAKIEVFTIHDHKTVSDGAAHALNAIGTPSANACLEKWRMKAK